MTLTSDILRAAYAYLAETPPFSEWNLPDAEDVMFSVIKTRTRHGRCYAMSDPIKIEISNSTHDHTATLMATMAHEMIHVHQIAAGLPYNHGKAFRLIADQVCAVHGFDPGQF